MKGLLVRVGCDQTPDGGRWNAPVELATGRFCYVPIPESKPNRASFERPYVEVVSGLAGFGLEVPLALRDRRMHLDPDFEQLTYGDRGPKGKQIAGSLARGDFLAFYAGLRDTGSGALVYGLIGLIVVDRICHAREMSPNEWHRNAHCRRELLDSADDVVVVGQPGVSGRLSRCLVIGEYRDRAYRVTRPLLEAWGGISANDGFLQRSAVFPKVGDGGRFMEWFGAHGVELKSRNWESPA